MRRVAVLLAHHPVLDRQGAVVTTAITNLDLHDIARSAFTFGLGDFFVAHPVAAQRELALRVREHWTTGSGARRIPDRKPPMECVRVVESLDRALDELGEATRTVLCFGNTAPMQVIADRLIVGERLGAVPSSAPATPLLKDLEREQKRVRLKPSAESKLLDLDLRRELDRDRSRLIHRLRLLVSHGASKPQEAGARGLSTRCGASLGTRRSQSRSSMLDVWATTSRTLRPPLPGRRRCVATVCPS